MIRAILAVAVAGALVGAAGPVVESGRTDAADRTVRGEVRAIENAAAALLEADEVGPGPGARRVLTVEVPASTHRTAGVDYLAIHGGGATSTGGSTNVTYRLGGHPEQTVTLGVALYTGGSPLVLGDGRHRLVLELTAVDGRRVVWVRRG